MVNHNFKTISFSLTMRTNVKLLTLSRDDYWLTIYRHANLQYMTIRSNEEGDSIHLMWVSFGSVFTCEYYCIETLMVYRTLWV